MKQDLAGYLLKEVEYWKDSYAKSQAEISKLKEEKGMGSGLGGLPELLEGPLGQILVPIVTKFLEGGGNLTGPGKDERMIQVLNFLQSNPPEVQSALYEFMDVLAGRSVEENLKMLTYLNNATRGAAVEK